MDQVRGAPLDNAEVLFRLIRNADWLTPELAFEMYLRRLDEEYLSFARGERPPDCEEQYKDDWPNKTYGSDRLAVTDIRSTIHQYLADECAFAHKNHDSKGIIDVPDPHSASARRIAIRLSEISEIENRNGCKNGLVWHYQRAHH